MIHFCPYPDLEWVAYRLMGMNFSIIKDCHGN